MTIDNGTGDREALQAEIRRTRAELGETIEALAAKADVKARLRSTAAQTKQRVRLQADRAAGVVRRPVRDAGQLARRNVVPVGVVGAAAVGAVTIVILIMVMRGRHR
ncbi:DUF3618 domain-containing protein [Micromonospora sp. NPDC003197]